jgi:feruloyl esterase
MHSREVLMRAAIILSTVLLGSGAGMALATDAATCEGLRNTVFSGGYATSARVIPAAETLPEYCEVRATALPAISIEVRLPLTGWNGKYYQAGCGGFCGILGRADAGAGWINAMRPPVEQPWKIACSEAAP